MTGRRAALLVRVAALLEILSRAARSRRRDVHPRGSQLLNLGSKVQQLARVPLRHDRRVVRLGVERGRVQELLT